MQQYCNRKGICRGLGNCVLRQTCSAVAPPPTSRKFAGLPPNREMMSRVAMARPAPFTEAWCVCWGGGGEREREREREVDVRTLMRHSTPRSL